MQDHIVHHILTLFALGASASEIQRQYEYNLSYQRSLEPVDNVVLEHLRSYAKFDEYLGKEKYYHEYLLFFQSEIDKKGFKNVIEDFCLKGDGRANDMLVRLHAGKRSTFEALIWHPEVFERFPPSNDSSGIWY